MKKIGMIIAIAIAIASMTVENTLTAETDKGWPSVNQDALEHWKDLRFGMFIHWGPSSLTGHEIGWARGLRLPTEEYDNLYQRFNPIEFDADAWVQTAKAAGMKYIVITTKHHDGFSLWPSEFTEYDIAATPFKRDVLGELAEACRKHGIEFGTYYSVADWWHPDYPKGSPGGRTDKPNPDLDSYMDYVINKTTELQKNYGPLLTMWFDVPREVEIGHGMPAVMNLRRLQPDILINDRAYMGAPGDYATPEQRIGGFDRERPWETCMTLGTSWSWKPDDDIKSVQESVRTLLSTIGGDGNLLFNVGPMPDGRIEHRQVERLQEMGEWVKAHAAGIYGTRGGPFKPGFWGASTCKEDRIYLYVMNWGIDGSLDLPVIDTEIVEVRFMDGRKVDWEQGEKGIRISVPSADRDAIASAIELIVDGDALKIAPTLVPEMPSGSVAFGKPAKASSVFQGRTDQFGPAKAFDDDHGTRWATDNNITQAWIEIDLEEPKKIGKVYISEGYAHPRIQSAKLQFMQDGEWVDIFEGTQIGKDFRKQFGPVKAQRFRLLIEQSKGGPTLNEIRLFSAD